MNVAINSDLFFIAENIEEYTITSFQASCSRMIQDFKKEVCNPLTMMSLITGGAVARTVELTCFRSLSSIACLSSPRFAQSIAYFSSFAGVTTEAGFFAGMPMIETGGSFSTFGIGTGHGALVIGLSRIVGKYTHSNFLISCLAQDGIVMGVDLTFETLNLREVQNIGGTERWFHARAVGFQMHFSGLICHSIPGVAQNQALFSVKKEILKTSLSSSPKSSRFSGFSWGRQLVADGVGTFSEHSFQRETENNEQLKTSHLVMMAKHTASQRSPQVSELAPQFRVLMESAKEGKEGAIDTLKLFIIEGDAETAKLAATALGGAASHPEAQIVLEELAGNGGHYSSLCQEMLDRSDDSGQMFGIDLRDYQREDIAQAIEAIEAGKDRFLIRNPWQTGKSLGVGPLGEIVRERHFRGKPILILVPFIVNKDQMLGDLVKNPLLRIGVIDNENKDFGNEFDYVVASTFTLARENNLDRFDPYQYSLVVMDEAGYALTRSSVEILIKLGFLDEQGKIKKNPRKFLLGLTADQHSLESIFGKDAEPPPRDLTWFIGKGYLHRPIGTRRSYKNIHTFEEVSMGKDRIRTPQNGPIYDAEIIQAYEDLLMGKQTIIKVASIAHARSLENAFNRKYRPGFAEAVYSYDTKTKETMTNADFDKILERYNASKTTVLIQVLRLSHSFRARNTEGVIVACEISSLRLYGQIVGRPLGVIEEKGVREPQRKILIVDMRGKERKLYNPATLPRLGGLLEYERDDLEFDLMKVLNTSRTKQPGARPRTRVRALEGRAYKGILEYEYVEDGEKGLCPEFFPLLLQQVLERNYLNQRTRMARALQIDLSELDRYLYGELPSSLEKVRQMADRLKIEQKRFLLAWENDFLKIVEGLHPIDKNFGPYTRQLVEMVRLASLHLGNGSLTSVLRVCPEINPTVLKKIFKGKLPPRSSQIFFTLEALIRKAGLISPQRIQTLMSRSYRELYGKMRKEIKLQKDIKTEKVVFVPNGLTPADILTVDESFRLENLILNPEETPFEPKRSELIRAALAKLSRKHREVIEQRFSLRGENLDHEPTLEEIANQYADSPENIRQLLQRAFSRLRKTREIIALSLGDEPAKLHHPLSPSLVVTHLKRKYWHVDPAILDKPIHFTQAEIKKDTSWLKEKFPRYSASIDLRDNEIVAEKVKRVIRKFGFPAPIRNIFIGSWREMIRCVKMLENTQRNWFDGASIKLIVGQVFSGREKTDDSFEMALIEYLRFLDRENGY